MKTKSKIANIDEVVGELVGETEIYAVIEEQEEHFSTEIFLSFPFNLEQEKVQFLRSFVLFKRNLSPEFFHYNNSHAIREGIDLLGQAHPNLKKRPKTVKIPTRLGSQGSLNGKVKLKTSYWINEVERDFIYNFIYANSIIKNEYSKSDFMDDLIKILCSTYPEMKKATK